MRRLLLPSAAAALALVATARPDDPAPPVASRIFVNARVWTADPARPSAAALALAGDRVLAVGSGEEVLRHRGPSTTVADLHGRLVAPGFNDAHLHFLVLEIADLVGAYTVEAVQERIRDYAAANPKAAWVVGRGWNYSAFPGALPTRAQLDAVVPDRPALMTAYDGHTGWANSRALALAGITRDTPDPPNGVIVKDAKGEPTGALKEAAQGLVRRLVPPPTDEERYRALKKRLAQAASYGLTSVQNASFIGSELAAWDRVIAEDGLKVRVYWALPFRKAATDEERAADRALREKYRGNTFRTGAVKGMLDGVVESKTAAMLEPYVGGGTGHLNWTDEELRKAAEWYDREGYQIFLHAIGDRAIRQALDAYEHVARVNGPRDRRHRVEHVEVPDPADVPRFARLGVIASTQALFAHPDQNTLVAYAGVLGPEREARAMAFAQLDRAGARQAFGSDWPVFSMEVLRGIHCAVTRQTPEGTPAGGWQPQHRLSVEAALRHFTADAAYASFDEDEKGVLAPGRLADLVVISHDITQAAPERILEARVLLTVMGGRDTYRADGF